MEGRGKHQLSEEENRAVQAELKRLAEAHPRGLRGVGVALGFPEVSAQSTISQAIRGRAGALVASRLYEFLGVTRDEFMGRVRLTPAIVLDESNWAPLGLDPEQVTSLVDTIRKELDALKKPPSDPPSAPQIPTQKKRS